MTILASDATEEIAQSRKLIIDELKELVTEEEIYHPIDLPEFEGRKVSRPSADRWQIIKNYLDAEDISLDGMAVLDLACHYGYFSFIMAELGAKVWALDKNAKNIIVCNLIKRIKQTDPKFFVDDLVSYCCTTVLSYDLVLAMNCFHYPLAPFSRDEVVRFFSRLSDIVGRYFICSYPATVVAHQGNQVHDIMAMGGFKEGRCIGVPDNSYPILFFAK